MLPRPLCCARLDPARVVWLVGSGCGVSVCSESHAAEALEPVQLIWPHTHSPTLTNCPLSPAGLEISGFLFNSQFRPQTRLHATSFKEGGAAAAAASAAVSGGKVGTAGAVSAAFFLLLCFVVEGGSVAGTPTSSSQAVRVPCRHFPAGVQQPRAAAPCLEAPALQHADSWLQEAERPPRPKVGELWVLPN